MHEADDLQPGQTWTFGPVPRPRLRPSWTLEASLLTNGQIDARRFITHHFGLDEFEEAYDVFARAADTRALKVVRTR